MKLSIRISLLLVLLSFQIKAQVAPDKYRIYFKDKNHSTYSLEHPEEFLSEKALERRLKQNIQLKENDLPVSEYYLDSLRNLGATVLNTSKWLNTAVIYTSEPGLLVKLSTLNFIKEIKSLTNSQSLSYNSTDKFNQSKLAPKNSNDFDYGESGTQLYLHNGHILHQNGFQGQGILIAVIDAGFYQSNTLPAFDSLFANNQIISTYDFVDRNPSVYEDHNHGMSVLSIIGGNISGQLIGSSPKANFLLLRSEDANSEYPVEEDNWAAAAEFADSAGADIINTSLGYSVFDDPSQNYTYSDMDGNTAFITKAADIASSKGILVVVSAGNEGNTSWKYISAPADGDSVLAVGAIDRYGAYVTFSSQGPTSDGRTKPNVAAMGYQTTVQDIFGQVVVGNGTSYSAPIITGLSACLWQAIPNLTNLELIERIEQSSNNYLNPDNFLGYGIPDFARAANLSTINQPVSNLTFTAYPNPFTKHLSVYFYSIDNQTHPTKIELYNLLGEKVYQTEIAKNTNKLAIDNLEELPVGIYIVSVITDKNTHQIRVIKTN
ncbi:MAG: S8 family serine peptidase [Bacteroidales bacterium]|jgi:hypothetical protein|nr:S8 family serine peptidase [Bacteroidales bacterium]